MDRVVKVRISRFQPCHKLSTRCLAKPSPRKLCPSVSRQKSRSSVTHTAQCLSEKSIAAAIRNTCAHGSIFRTVPVASRRHPMDESRKHDTRIDTLKLQLTARSTVIYSVNSSQAPTVCESDPVLDTRGKIGIKNRLSHCSSGAWITPRKTLRLTPSCFVSGALESAISSSAVTMAVCSVKAPKVTSDP